MSRLLKIAIVIGVIGASAIAYYLVRPEPVAATLKREVEQLQQIVRGEPVTNEAQAIQIATAEVVKRGWKEFTVTKGRLNHGEWLVFAQRLPVVFDGHALVYVPTNGLPVRYSPGK